VLQIVPIHYDIRNDALLEAILARSNVVINLLGERPASPRPPPPAPLPAAGMSSCQAGSPALGFLWLPFVLVPPWLPLTCGWPVQASRTRRATSASRTSTWTSPPALPRCAPHRRCSPPFWRCPFLLLLQPLILFFLPPGPAVALCRPVLPLVEASLTGLSCAACCVQACVAHGGIQRFVHVSCLNASPSSPSAQLRTKAAGEAAVRALLPEVSPAPPAAETRD
jgi:hypothetical protein